MSLFQYGYVLRKIYSLLPFILDKLIVSGEERKNSIRIFFIQYTVFRFIENSPTFSFFLIHYTIMTGKNDPLLRL